MNLTTKYLSIQSMKYSEPQWTKWHESGTDMIQDSQTFICMLLPRRN